MWFCARRALVALALLEGRGKNKEKENGVLQVLQGKFERERRAGLRDRAQRCSRGAAGLVDGSCVCGATQKVLVT